MKGNLLMKTILTLSLAQVSWSYAGEFHTIIGPDGRPMIIQREPKKPAAAKPNPNPVVANQSVSSQPVAIQQAATTTISPQPPLPKAVSKIETVVTKKPFDNSKVEQDIQSAEQNTIKTVKKQTQTA